MIANARMYSVNAADRRGVARVAANGSIARADVDARGHRLSAAAAACRHLWARDDLACAFMCGYPFATRRPPPAASCWRRRCRSGAVSATRRVYWTDIVVRADSAIATLGDIFGAPFRVHHARSQSGYQAPRALFAPLAHASAAGALFAAMVGPLVTPRARRRRRPRGRRRRRSARQLLRTTCCALHEPRAGRAAARRSPRRRRRRFRRWWLRRHRPTPTSTPCGRAACAGAPPSCARRAKRSRSRASRCRSPRNTRSGRNARHADELGYTVCMKTTRC